MIKQFNRFDLVLISLIPMLTVCLFSPMVVFAIESNEAPAGVSLIFNDRPLLPEWVEWFTGSANISVELLTFKGNEFRDVYLPLKATDEVVTIADGSATFANGSLALDFVHSRAGSAVALTGNGIDANLVPALKRIVTAGVINFNIDIEGVGGSPREIASTADGSITISVHDGMIVNSGLERAGQNLFSLMTSGLNPFRPDDEPTRMKCAKARLDIVGGRVDVNRMFGVQTDAINIVCGGTLNFETEAVALTCRPEQTEGHFLEVTSLVESIHIDGSILQPTLAVDKVGIVRQSASFGAGITSFDLSKFRSLLGAPADPLSVPCALSLP